jgi:Bacterial Ig-like domain (group 3)/FG-GAP-like repeat
MKKRSACTLMRRVLSRAITVGLALFVFGIATRAQQLPPLPTAPDDVPRDYSNAGNQAFQPGKADGDIGGFGLGTPWELYVKSAMQVWGVPDPAGPGLTGTPPYFPYLVRQANCSLTRYVADSTGTIVETQVNFQDTLHQNQRIPTVGDKFTHGCQDPSIGIASQIFAVAGVQSNGNEALAYISPNGMTVVIHDNAGNIVAPTPTAYNTVVSTSGGVVYGLAAADLNNDGFIDIVVASSPTGSTSGQLSVFLGNAAGVFTLKQTIVVPMPASTGALGVTIDSLNGDTFPDLLAVTTGTSTTSGVTLFTGKGDGTFNSGVSVGPAGTGGHVAVTGDFGNGHRDIATSFGNILMNDGTGTFTPVAQSWTEAQSLGVAAADFNQDGKIDLAFTNATTVGATATIDVYFGNGAGAFTFSASYPTISGAQSIQATDLDGDGFPDLFVGTAEGGFYWSDQNTQTFFGDHLNHGDGTFGQSQAYPPSTFTATNFAGISSYYDVGNFTSGKTPDLLTFDFESGTASLSVLKANVDGTFNRTGINTLVNEFTTPGFLVQIISADVDGDGVGDAVFFWNPSVGNNTTATVAIGDGAGHFTTLTDYPNLPQLVAATAVDVNGDGKDDIVFIGQTGAATTTTGLYVMLNKGDGTFNPATLVDAQPNMGSLAVGDLNGDGHPDIVIATTGDNTVVPAVPGVALVYLANSSGNGTFQIPAVSYNLGNTLPGGVAIADVNGDGKPDLVIAGTIGDLSGGNITTLIGAGAGAFVTTGVVTPQPNIFPVGLVVADLNRDSKSDVILGGGLGGYSYMALGNGDGTFGVASSGTAANVFIGVGSRFLKLTDINGDGAPDLLITSNANNGSVIETFVTNLISTTTALQASSTTVTAGQSVTFTATVTPGSGASAPTGTVNFLDGTTVVGSGTLNGSGVATFPTATLAPGAHSISAVYQGDLNFAGSASSVVQVQVNADFAFSSASPSPQTVSPGAGATYTVTLTGAPGFSQAVTISCTVSPVGPACTPPSSPVTPTTSGAQVQVNVTTTKGSGVSVRWQPNRPWWWALAFLGLMAAIYMAAFKQIRRHSVGRAYRTAFWASALLAAAFIAGCGSSSNSGGGSTGGTPAGSYTITITGTAGSTTHSATATLVVQ